MKVKAILVPVGEMPREVMVDGLEDLRRLVGGAIDAMGWVFGEELSLYVNDEGKFTCAPNRAIYATADDEGSVLWDGTVVHEGDLLDIVFGDFVAVGFDSETGEDRDLTEGEARKVMERFGTAESIASGLAETLRITSDHTARQ